MEQQNVMFEHIAGGPNPRPKGFKFNKGFQVALLLAMCIWLLYQIKHSYYDNSMSNGRNMGSKLHKEHANMLIGRKGIAGILVGAMTESVGESAGDNNEFRKNLEGENRELLSDGGGGGGGGASETDDEGEMEIGFHYFPDENGVPLETSFL